MGLNQAFLLDGEEGEHKNKGAYRTLIKNAWALVYGIDEGDAAVIAENVVNFETKLAEVI